MSDFHKYVSPRDAAIESSTLRLRAANQAILNEPLASPQRIKELLKEHKEAHEGVLASHALPQTFICDHKKCGKELNYDSLVLIPFMRVIRDGQFLMDDGREKHLRLCAKCFDSLGLIKS